MNKFSVETLSVVLNIELGEMFTKTVALNKKHKLGIEDFSNMTRKQFDIVRAAHDTAYMVLLLGGEEDKTAYDYKNTPLWSDLIGWLSEYDLNEFTTKDIKATLPNHLKRCSLQTIAAAMRSQGYENKRMYIGEGEHRKQARLWYKFQVDPSFF